mmetsp:Transcript_50518/g.105530  ORF Transcript_50518/g.105530 Transcript_50518/m.105530 type:complete len:90 (-) Transcript_50518:278-547(-)
MKLSPFFNFCGRSSVFDYNDHGTVKLKIDVALIIFKEVRTHDLGDNRRCVLITALLARYRCNYNNGKLMTIKLNKRLLTRLSNSDTPSF